jgi:hypothetical protein
VTDDVLERRSEIGLRRALGATKGHIRIQFLSEVTLLSLIGGIAGITAGAIATAIYAHAKGWATLIPTEAWAGGIGATILNGALAGLLPALRRPHAPHRRAVEHVTAPLPSPISKPHSMSGVLQLSSVAQPTTSFLLQSMTVAR